MPWGRFTVDGAGSLIDLTQSAAAGSFGGPLLLLGDAGLGGLAAVNGGHISVTGAASTVILGRQTGGVGDLSLNGTGSLLLVDSLTDGGLFDVGASGGGSFALRGGATASLAVENVTVGTSAGANGAVLVEGAGSRLDIDGPFFDIGPSGTGAVTVTLGGQIISNPTGLTFVGREAGGNGQVVVNAAGSLLDAGETLIIGAGYDFATGSVLFTSGGSGQVMVGPGGTVQAGAALNDGIDDIVLGSGGLLQVLTGGTVMGDILNQGGTLVAGASPGTAALQGDLTHNAGTLLVEVAGPGPGQFDFYDVSGTAALNGGLIEFAFIGGYAPTMVDSFPFHNCQRRAERGFGQHADRHQRPGPHVRFLPRRLYRQH